MPISRPASGGGAATDLLWSPLTDGGFGKATISGSGAEASKLSDDAIFLRGNLTFTVLMNSAGTGLQRSFAALPATLIGPAGATRLAVVVVFDSSAGLYTTTVVEINTATGSLRLAIGAVFAPDVNDVMYLDGAIPF